MTARLLVFALLFGAAGGALSALALGARPGSEGPGEAEPPPAVAHAEPEAAAREPLRAAPEPAGTGVQPTLVGRPDAASPEEDATSTERIVALEAQMAALTERMSELAARVPPDLDTLNDEELRARGSSLYTFKDYAGTLEAYEALLAREPNLDAETRSEVLSAMAQCHRALGRPDQADALFQKVEALHGEGTAGAMTARYQRAWIQMAKGDLEGAREFMRQVSRSESSPSFWRLFSRANAADFSIRMGDTVGVRQDLEEFRLELENTEGATAGRVMAYVDRLLEQLDS